MQHKDASLSFTVEQGSPNFVNKGPVYCSSDFFLGGGAGLWPLRVEKVPTSVGKKQSLIVGVSWGNCALSLVSMGGIVPHSWCQ